MAFTPIIKFYYAGGAGIEFTSIVLSAEISTGRSNFVDQYSGKSAKIVIKNSSNESSVFTINQTIGIFNGNNIFWRGRVSGISYEDNKVDSGLSTATLTVDDQFARLGRVKVANRTILSNLGSTQLLTFNSTTYGGVGPLTDVLLYELGYPSTAGYQSSSTMSGSVFTGSVLDYMNKVQSTENANMIVTGDSVAMVSRTIITNDIYKMRIEEPESSGLYVNLKLGRTSSDTTIMYDSFTRSNFLDFFAKNVSVEPAGLAAQIGQNAYSYTTFGEYSYSRSTIDQTTAQALVLAKNLAQKLSDQIAVQFNISFLLESQNETVAQIFLNSLITAKVIDVVYRVPGSGTDTTTPCVIEGATYSLRPKQTRFTLNLTPLAVYTEYQNFTLDTGYGVLNQDTLG